MPRFKYDEKEHKKKTMQLWIKNQLKEQDITQKQLAERMNMPLRTFNWKLEHMTFDYEDLLMIFTTFNTDDKVISLRMKM